MLKFCLTCNSLVTPEDDMCPDCGLRFRQNTDHNCFLSGPFVHRAPLVRLARGAKLMSRFLIKGHLGEGRFGTVYEAEDKIRSTDVALKVVEAEARNNDTAWSRVQHEMLINRSVSDFSHVIQLYELHCVPWGATGLLVLSMEYANGGTFRRWLSEHANDWQARTDAGIGYFKQACHGVAAFHDVQIALLDVKPENMLLHDSILKIADFGAAKKDYPTQNPNDFCSEKSSPRESTPSYMSPEHFTAHDADDVDHRADIYSLGIVLYEVLHPKCRLPFNGSCQQLQRLHLKAPPPDLPADCENLTRVVARCLQKNPSSRYQHVWDLLEDMEHGASAEPNPAVLAGAGMNGSGNELEESFNRASQCLSDGMLNEAATLAEEVLRLNPDHAGAKRLRGEIGTRFSQAEEFYRDILQHVETGDLGELTTMVEEAVRIYPGHPSGDLAQARLAARVRRYREAMEKGEVALRAGHWGFALNWFRKALQLHPGAVQLGKIIESLDQIDQMTQAVDEALVARHFNKAQSISRFMDVLIDEMEASIPILREAGTR
ncbi:MAG: protein kinase [Thermodesulfobacteriota bacterium]|nr:protein kinase [Thermodesulfobacteriota bacterium]